VDALKKDPTVKPELADRFSARLSEGHYASLPGRPLFLRMLADLEVRNQTEVSIDDRLSGNLSEIYFKFISWKIEDDYARKGGVKRFDAGVFALEAFDLLSRLAAVEYKRERSREAGAISLRDVREILSTGDFQEIGDEAVDALLHSSLFSILRRTDEKSFQFSHKSFMEYLVAHLYAATIFATPGKPANSTCSGVWGQYQTYEVSQHFLHEVDRIRLTNDLTEAMVLNHFRSAFVQVLKQDQSDSRELNERVQSVLYYAGRLKLHDEEIQQRLHSIIKSPEQNHAIYRRSAAISLATIESPKYADDYALSLLTRRGPGSDFATNLAISKDYYGVPGIERVLRHDLDRFLDGKGTSSIISLKLLTYCAYMAEAHPDKREDLRTVVKRTRTEGARLGRQGIVAVCDRIDGDLLCEGAP
jgi:hypothetical protein